MGWLIGIGIGIWVTVFTFGVIIWGLLYEGRDKKSTKYRVRYRVRVIPSMLSLMKHGIDPFSIDAPYTVELPEIPTEGDAVVTGKGKDRFAHIVGPSIIWSRVDDDKEYTAFIVATESVPMDIETLKKSLMDSVKGPLNNAAEKETEEQHTDTDAPTQPEYVPPEEREYRDDGV